MEKKEKIFIVLATAIILIAIFIAFIISNSQKVPPEVLVQNEDRKVVNAVMGGYTWKVFGTNVIADAVDLKTLDYSTENTIVSKTGEMLTLSTTEKFSVQEINCFEIGSDNIVNALARNNETGNYFTMNVPELEGAYLCIFKLEYYGKGSAEYAIKIVVTDENVYEVSDIISYKNTDILSTDNIKGILSKLPYANKLNGIIINGANGLASIKIKYEENSIEKEDLLNNTIALFALIPELDSVTYAVNPLKDDIYYTRDEVNNLLERNVLEYAENTELWTKEIIYKEQVSKYNNDISIYASVINTALSNLKENEIGKYVAIDITENSTSGEISMNEYDVKILLDELSAEYELVLNVNKEEFINKNGSLVLVQINEKTVDGAYIVNVEIENANNKKSTYVYKATKEVDSVKIENYDSTLETAVENSGDVE